jgi:protein-tyrosine phosphatase
MHDQPIEGTLNFRSVRAYPADGGRLKPYALYRSGEFHGITGTGLDVLRRLGATTAFDLRSETERTRRRSPLLSAPDFRVVCETHDFRNGDLRAVLADARSSPEACADVMRAIYAVLPEQFAAVFRSYFRMLAAGPTPLVVHCAAGKDRTGVAVALLLDLVGVSRDDVMEDYLTTNLVRDQLRDRFRGHNEVLGHLATADSLIEPVISADETYLATMFEAVGRCFGDTRRYARQGLGLGDDEIEAIKVRLIA